MRGGVGSSNSNRNVARRRMAALLCLEKSQNYQQTTEMPYCEIEITARKMICVGAVDEDQALEIAEYKQSGDYLSA